ncbi:MAG TPA: transposase [Acidimicrobiales bacterium]|nr:transposase [Acidimicrobiales bacterium]
MGGPNGSRSLGHPAWHHAHVSNGPTDAVNNLIKRVKRVAFGFRRFAHYRIRARFTPADPTGTYSPRSHPLKSEESDKHRDGDASGITEVTTLGPRSASAPFYPDAQTWTGEGYFEARIRYTSETNNWPAFWLFGQALAQVWQPGGSGDAACPQLQTEWDIVDNFGPAADEWIYATHDNTSERCQTEDHPVVQPVPTGQDLSQWHTFAGRWQDGQLCHYLDNAEVGCLPVPNTFGVPMFLIFTTRIGCIGDGCDGSRPTQVSMDVDWVRVWQR